MSNSKPPQVVDRRDQSRARLRDMLLLGASAPLTGKADAVYIDGLRAAIRNRAVPPAPTLAPSATTAIPIPVGPRPRCEETVRAAETDGRPAGITRR